MVFAPTPRDYTIRPSRKEEGATFRFTLTSHVQGNKFIMVNELKFDEIKTKKFQNIMDDLKVSKALVVLADNDQNTVLSAGNIAGVKTPQVGSINIYGILKYNTVVTAKTTVASIKGAYA